MKTVSLLLGEDNLKDMSDSQAPYLFISIYFEFVKASIWSGSQEVRGVRLGAVSTLPCTTCTMYNVHNIYTAPIDKYYIYYIDIISAHLEPA